MKTQHTETNTHTYARTPPASGLLVKLKGLSAFPRAALLSLSPPLVLIKRRVSKVPPSGAVGGRGAERRDGDERSSPAEALGA